jgi:hypothetical protein
MGERWQSFALKSDIFACASLNMYLLLRVEAPDTWYLAPGTWHLAPGTWHLALGTRTFKTESFFSIRSQIKTISVATLQRYLEPNKMKIKNKNKMNTNKIQLIFFSPISAVIRRKPEFF